NRIGRWRGAAARGPVPAPVADLYLGAVPARAAGRHSRHCGNDRGPAARRRRANVYAGGADRARRARVAGQPRRAARGPRSRAAHRARGSHPPGRRAGAPADRRRVRPRRASRQPARGTPAIRARIHRLGARAPSLAHERRGAHARHRARQFVSQDAAAGHPPPLVDAGGLVSKAPVAPLEKMFRPIAACLVLVASFLPAPARAQDADTPPPPGTLVFGPLHVTPSVRLTDLGVDNNVFNEPVDPKSDFTFTVSPQADLALRIRRLRLSYATLVDYVYYQKYESE